jgi:Rrf2 family protein
LFSTTFRYALICLLELADAEETLQAGRIARKFQLSPHYLSVVLRELRRLGLIESQKGNRGGYRLVLPPHQITMLFLHSSLAGSTPSCEPASGAAIKNDPPQGVADRWLQATADRWSTELASTTLQDLASLR